MEKTLALAVTLVLAGTLWTALRPAHGEGRDEAKGEAMPAPVDPANDAWKLPADDPKLAVEKSDAEWEKLLTKEQFYVLRKAGTERAFTGPYWDNHAAGVYRCAACGLELFSSETKFESGTGWPSFWQPIAPAHVATKSDRSFFTTRTEVLCPRCGGHLGHVFDDGPAPTGQRYCMNGTALSFERR